jgi:hypothetical protein
MLVADPNVSAVEAGQQISAGVDSRSPLAARAERRPVGLGRGDTSAAPPQICRDAPPIEAPESFAQDSPTRTGDRTRLQLASP